MICYMMICSCYLMRDVCFTPVYFIYPRLLTINIIVSCNFGGTVSLISRMRSEEVAPPVFPHSANSYFNSQEQVFTIFHTETHSFNCPEGYHSMYARVFSRFLSVIVLKGSCFVFLIRTRSY